MKMIVGLGNPGRQYHQTRHNVGFEVVRNLAVRWGLGRSQGKFQGELTESRIAEQKVLLLTPLTYMNLSGRSVQPAAAFYQLSLEDLLIVCDDFSLPLGRIRIRPSGSSGGQKGLESIIQRLGTRDVPRLRVGIGPVPEGWDVSGFVLGKFSADQLNQSEQVIRRAADAAAAWVENGIDHCMNHFNRTPEELAEQREKQRKRKEAQAAKRQPPQAPSAGTPLDLPASPPTPPPE